MLNYQVEPQWEKALAAPVIPQSREAEESVIGAVLIDPLCFGDLQFLAPDDFYIVRHRWIWEVFATYYQAGQPIDFLTVTNRLEQLGQLSEIGGPAYLTGLLNQTPTVLHAEAYAKMVHACGVRRRLLTAANQIAKLAYNEAEDIEEVIGQSSEAVGKAVSTFSFGHEKKIGRAHV